MHILSAPINNRSSFYIDLCMQYSPYSVCSTVPSSLVQWSWHVFWARPMYNNTVRPLQIQLLSGGGEGHRMYGPGMNETNSATLTSAGQLLAVATQILNKSSRTYWSTIDAVGENSLSAILQDLSGSQLRGWWLGLHCESYAFIPLFLLNLFIFCSSIRPAGFPDHWKNYWRGWFCNFLVPINLWLVY